MLSTTFLMSVHLSPSLIIITSVDDEWNFSTRNWGRSLTCFLYLFYNQTPSTFVCSLVGFFLDNYYVVKRNGTDHLKILLKAWTLLYTLQKKRFLVNLMFMEKENPPIFFFVLHFEQLSFFPYEWKLLEMKKTTWVFFFHKHSKFFL